MTEPKPAALQPAPSAWYQAGAGYAKPTETWFLSQLLLQALCFHVGWYHQSKISTDVTESRVKFLKQRCVWPSFLAASNTGARSVVASLLFQVGKTGRWWNEYSPEALENWRQMMVHPSRQALADEQEHALMDTSSRDTFILQDWPVGIITHQSPYKNNMRKRFQSGYFQQAGGSRCFPANQAPPDLLLNRSWNQRPFMLLKVLIWEAVPASKKSWGTSCPLYVLSSLWLLMERNAFLLKHSLTN